MITAVRGGSQTKPACKLCMLEQHSFHSIWGGGGGGGGYVTCLSFCSIAVTTDVKKNFLMVSIIAEVDRVVVRFCDLLGRLPRYRCPNHKYMSASRLWKQYRVVQETGDPHISAQDRGT